MLVVVLLLAGSARGEDRIAERPTRRHLVRLDLQTGVPIPLFIPELAARLSYAWFPAEGLSLEAAA